MHESNGHKLKVGIRSVDKAYVFIARVLGSSSVVTTSRDASLIRLED